MQKSASERGPLRSSVMTKGVDRATHRSLLYSMGWRAEHLEKPIVAVVNSFNELMPGHVHLNSLCQAIKLGIAEAGGTPLEFPTIAVCDGLATGHKGMKMPMPSRELIADSIEIMITAHAFDAMVLLTNCDKVTPGMLMAAARLNIPALLVSGGPMDTGCFCGKRVALICQRLCGGFGFLKRFFLFLRQSRDLFFKFFSFSGDGLKRRDLRALILDFSPQLVPLADLNPQNHSQRKSNHNQPNDKFLHSDFPFHCDYFKHAQRARFSLSDRISPRPSFVWQLLQSQPQPSARKPAWLRGVASRALARHTDNNGEQRGHEGQKTRKREG